MNDREVADYLLANPEFFARHAELLATIRLANPHGKAAISLQERQMEMLRDKNKHLERRLAELVRYGHENDSLSAKFGRWTARVIAERDPYALPRTIADGIADVFDVPQTALRVWDVADTYAQAECGRIGRAARAARAAGRRRRARIRPARARLARSAPLPRRHGDRLPRADRDARERRAHAPAAALIPRTR
ncbi:hypothetical protein FEP65_04003 [Burkholderia multivorans]|nr:hypothetical protein [Burkholderia multivorans]